MSNRLRQFASLLVLTLFATIAANAGDYARGTAILIRDSAAETATEQLVGSGIALPGGKVSKAAQDAHGREIVWRERRRNVNDMGMTHVFYRQFLVGDGVEAELLGSDIGLHYLADGTLDAVVGTQFASVMVTNRPILDRAHAGAAARRAVRTPMRLRPAAEAVPTEVTSDEGRGKLQLMDLEGNGELRYIWRVEAFGDGPPQEVFIDAQSEQVVSVRRNVRSNNCFPDSLNSIDAISYPVRDDLKNQGWLRWIGATPVTNNRGGYSHEAFWAVGPLLAVHQDMPDSPANTPWQCNDTGHKQYSLVALSTNEYNQPVYDGGPGSFFKTRVAGDAMYHTYLTMDAFQRLGRGGWDNNWGNATVVIESTSVFGAADTDFAFFRESPPTATMPPGAAVSSPGRFAATTSPLRSISLRTSGVMASSTPTSVSTTPPRLVPRWKRDGQT